MATSDRTVSDAVSGPAIPGGATPVACPEPGEALGAITLIAARRWQPPPVAWVMLFGCLLLIAFWSLLPGPALGDHECYVAQTSREMLADGDWVIPRFSGMPRLQKSPLAYWCVTGLTQALGRLNDGIVRLPSGLSGLALAGLMALLGRRGFGTAALGWFAAAVCGFSGAWLFHTHNGAVDMQLTFWCTLAGALFWLGVNSEAGHTSRTADDDAPSASRVRPVPSHSEGRVRRILLFSGMGVALGMAMLAKMPMPLAVLPPGFLLYLLATGRAGRIRAYLLESLPGLLLMLVIWLPWIVMVLHRLDDGVVGAKWYREFFMRYEGDIGANTQTWHYYAPVLLWMVLPWTPLLPEALAAPWLSRYRPWRDLLILAFCIVAFNLVFFSLAGYKRPQYILPAVPWLLLLLTPPVWRFFAGPIYEHPRLFARLGVGLAVVVIVGCGAGWFVLRHQDPMMSHGFAVPIGVMAAGLVSTGLVLALRARVEALYALLLTMTVTFCFGWTRTAIYWGPVPREQQFAEQFRRIVPANAAAYYLGRPDGSLVYYGRMLLPRVLSDLELEQQIQRRRMQRTVENGKVLTALRLIDLFKQDRPVYVVGTYGQWKELQALPSFLELQPQLPYRQSGFSETDKDWVVIANRAAATSSAGGP